MDQTMTRRNFICAGALATLAAGVAAAGGVVDGTV
jgi:hypothetical protein